MGIDTRHLNPSYENSPQIEYYQLGLDYPECYSGLIQKVSREDDNGSRKNRVGWVESFD